jgi:hypothetical protein
MCHLACMFSYIPPACTMWRAYCLPQAHGPFGCSTRGSRPAQALCRSKDRKTSRYLLANNTLQFCCLARQRRTIGNRHSHLSRWLRSISLPRKRVNVPHGVFIYAMWRIHLTHTIRCNLSPATVRRRGSGAILPIGKRDFAARGWGGAVLARSCGSGYDARRSEEQVSDRRISSTGSEGGIRGNCHLRGARLWLVGLRRLCLSWR